MGRLTKKTWLTHSQRKAKSDLERESLVSLVNNMDFGIRLPELKF